MDAGAAGVLDATIGGLAGVLGGLLTYGLQSKSDHEKWARDKQVEAYTSTIGYLMRVYNKRSSITADGKSVLGKDAMKEWFDEISEALACLTSLTIYCSERERQLVREGSLRLNAAVDTFIQQGSALGNLTETAHQVCIAVSEAARRDIGASVKNA